MAIKTIKNELEAKLFPVGRTSFFSRPRGKIERKVYGNGNERFKILISNFKLPDGEEVELAISDKVIATLKIKKGSAQLDLKSEQGASVPEVIEGDLAEVRYQGNIIVKGRFAED
jgi:hypothetical protein